MESFTGLELKNNLFNNNFYLNRIPTPIVSRSFSLVLFSVQQKFMFKTMCRSYLVNDEMSNLI